MTDDEFEQLVEASAAYRNAYFARLGQLNGNWSPIVNPRFNDGPVWPTRPGWQRIRDQNTTMVASSGLTDPWFESEAPTIGIGIEILLATNDDLPSDLTQMTGTWLYQFATAISNSAAADGRFALRYDKFGLFLFGVPCRDEFNMPDGWTCYDDCFGFLIGMSIPHHQMTFQLPCGQARLLTAKLLTPAEYLFVADNGPDGAAALRDRFVSDGSNHLSSLTRVSVV